MARRAGPASVLLALFLSPLSLEAPRILSAAPPGGGSAEDPGRDLAGLVARAGPGETIRLEAGHYELEPRDYVDPRCGNCEEPETPVAATLGLRVSGRELRLVGAGAGETVIHTRSGYGILFEDCEGCALEGVTVTDGARDPDGRATDAAVVVRRSRVLVRGCRIEENIGDPETVREVIVGVAGIVGREGAEIEVRESEILGNSWDGIALYRGAGALIENNRIDGVDAARGETVGGGRGVGVGITWDARAEVRGNLVARYWKGIGIFVDGRATVEENVVEDVLTWGISLWDAGEGKPSGVIRDNAVYRTGACGVAVIRESAGVPEPGELVGNALVRTGQDPKYDSGEPYCYQTAVARHAVPEGFTIRNNLYFENREPGDEPGGRDLPDREAFVREARDLLERLAERPALGESAFLQRFAPPDSDSP
jgi:hypothetical protein